jgi:DNA repair exonuclease SbcCD nuclease subunit
MAELLRNAYEHSGRVHVLDNDGVYIPYRMGNTFVMVHHSDKCPPARLVGVMTNDYREDFGQTEFHYIDMGHVHHHFVSKEYPGVVLESWNHLAPNDKWAHDAGYRSRKSISVVFRSRKFGDLGRRHLPLEEVRDRIQQSMPGIKAPAKKEVFTV